ncbi:MAG: thermonuclease family protein, partial [Nanoarchaeota archaeon]
MKRVRLTFFVFIFLVNGCITGSSIRELEGPFFVTNAVDGDTFDFGNNERVRMSGINTPETGECYYKEAKEKLAELILHKEIYLERDRSDKDKYERLLRYVYVNETGLVFVNGILVEEGYARVYDKYKSDTKRYDELKK